MRVGELMSRDVVTITTSESCHDAIALMHRKRIRHLPVVDEAGGLAGIVTDRDLRHRLFTPASWKHLGSVPVDTLLAAVPVTEVMSTPVVTASPEDDLETAARLMLEDKVGSVPVVHARRLVGILTETDLLRRVVQADACDPACETIIVSYP